MRIASKHEACTTLQVTRTQLQYLIDMGFLLEVQTPGGVKVDLNTLAIAVNNRLGEHLVSESLGVKIKDPKKATPKETRLYFKVSDRCLLKWVKAGKIKATKTPSGQKRYDLTSYTEKEL